MKLTRRNFLVFSTTISAGALLAACGSPQAETPAPTLESSPFTPTPDDKFDVLAEGLDFPEGPAFDSLGNVWCTELGWVGDRRGLVQLVDGKVRRISMDSRPNGMIFDRQGRAWVTDSGLNAIRRFDPQTETWETMLEAVGGDSLHTPNDLCFDAQGNLLFTCPNFDSSERTGYVVCLRPDGTASKIAEGYYRPNGLDIVDGGKALVVGDTPQKQLFKGAWNDQTCLWESPQPWAKVGGSEGPDGMTPGADGLLYAAIYGDGVIRVVDGSGKIVREIKVPGSNPTNVAVDPTGRLGIVVTETEKGRLLSYPGIKPGLATFDGGEAWK
jgi:gluconolactonase